MTDKAKRKGNPRRQLLVRLLIVIGLVVALISAGVYVLRPKGAEIVFIAPDDEGIDQIWIASVNQPENPRQLTHHSRDVVGLWISEENSVVAYVTGVIAREIYYLELWLYHIDTGDNVRILNCSEFIRCGSVSIHPDGQWLTYMLLEESVGGINTPNRYLHHIATSESILLHSYPAEDVLSDWNRVPGWLEDQIVYAVTNDTDTVEYISRDLSDRISENTISLNVQFLYPEFSPDGLHYAYYTADNGGIHDISVSSVDKPQGIEFTLQQPESRSFPITQFHDWHPDSSAILFIQYATGAGEENAISISNISSAETRILVSRAQHTYNTASFNYDGSQILYLKFSYEDRIEQLTIYDMESREEISLPLSGSNPQWVNGGR